MKLISILLFTSSFAACSGGEAEKVTTRENSDSSKVADEVPAFKGIRHQKGKELDLYFSQNAECIVNLINKDTLHLSGAWYISSKGSTPLTIKIANPAETKILSGRKLFFEYIPELSSIRITNFKGTITVQDHGRRIKLKRNETLLIDAGGDYNRFYNSYAASDTIWLTDTLVRLENVNLPTLISRMADRYGYKVHFNRSYDVLSRGSVQGSLDCRSPLKDGLEILTSTAEDSLKFGYLIKNGIVYIDRHKH